jgi:hypothetical protein
MLKELINFISGNWCESELESLKDLEDIHEELPPLYKEAIEFKKKMISKESEIIKELAKIQKTKRAIRKVF